MTVEQLRETADGARDAIELANPGIAVIVIVAEPHPFASPFAAAASVGTREEIERLLNVGRIALVGS